MTRKRESVKVPSLPEHESGVRSLVTEAQRKTYVTHKSLAETRLDPNGIVVFEGDDGGQIYLVAHISLVKCSVDQLQALLMELDALSWDDASAARIFFESLPVGASVPGGMGGGVVTTDLWVHPELKVSVARIRAVLSGEKTSIGEQVA